MENHGKILWNGWFRGSPIYGNLHICKRSQFLWFWHIGFLRIRQCLASWKSPFFPNRSRRCRDTPVGGASAGGVISYALDRASETFKDDLWRWWTAESHPFSGAELQKSHQVSNSWDRVWKCRVSQRFTVYNLKYLKTFISPARSGRPVLRSPPVQDTTLKSCYARLVSPVSGCERGLRSGRHQALDGGMAMGELWEISEVSVQKSSEIYYPIWFWQNPRVKSQNCGSWLSY